MGRVYIGLGANLGDPRGQIEGALRALSRLPENRLDAVSRLYRTAPVGPRDQPDYVNAVARIETRLTPHELLLQCQAIESAHGRVRDATRWGPRTLDLDILLYDDSTCSEADLKLPHPEMHRRGFVLVPLADIAPPTLMIPGQGQLRVLLGRVSRADIVPLPAALLSNA